MEGRRRTWVAWFAFLSAPCPPPHRSAGEGQHDPGGPRPPPRTALAARSPPGGGPLGPASIVHCACNCCLVLLACPPSDAACGSAPRQKIRLLRFCFVWVGGSTVKSCFFDVVFDFQLAPWRGVFRKFCSARGCWNFGVWFLMLLLFLLCQGQGSSPQSPFGAFPWAVHHVALCLGFLMAGVALPAATIQPAGWTILRSCHFSSMAPSFIVPHIN